MVSLENSVKHFKNNYTNFSVSHLENRRKKNLTYSHHPQSNSCHCCFSLSSWPVCAHIVYREKQGCVYNSLCCRSWDKVVMQRWFIWGVQTIPLGAWGIHTVKERSQERAPLSSNRSLIPKEIWEHNAKHAAQKGTGGRVLVHRLPMATA